MLSLSSEDLDRLAVQLADDIGQAEADVVATVLPDTLRLVPEAEAQGVSPAAFSHEDVRLIWCACDVARDRPLTTVLRLAKAALQQSHYWDPQGPIGTGCMWSDETLVRLAHSFPASVVATRYHARHLLALSRRWRMAEDLLQKFREVLAGEAEPVTPPAPTAKPMFVNAPPRRRRGVA